MGLSNRAGAPGETPLSTNCNAGSGGVVWVQLNSTTGEPTEGEMQPGRGGETCREGTFCAALLNPGNQPVLRCLSLDSPRVPALAGTVAPAQAATIAGVGAPAGCATPC